MRAIRLARPLAAAIAFGGTAGAAAPPPPPRQHRPPAAPAGTPSGARPLAARLAGVAYLSGKQPMVGWHAPSTRGPARDASGRSELVLTTINLGETVEVPATS